MKRKTTCINNWKTLPYFWKKVVCRAFACYLLVEKKSWQKRLCQYAFLRASLSLYIKYSLLLTRRWIDIRSRYIASVEKCLFLYNTVEGKLWRKIFPIAELVFFTRLVHMSPTVVLNAFQMWKARRVWFQNGCSKVIQPYIQCAKSKPYTCTLIPVLLSWVLFLLPLMGPAWYQTWSKYLW